MQTVSTKFIGDWFVKKILSCEMGFSAYEYKLSYHLVCFNNSYYPNACTWFLPHWQLQQFPFSQSGRLPENECELCYHVPRTCEEIQQVPWGSVTVYHGTFQHHYDAELLRTRNIRFRKGWNGKADCSIAADGFTTSFTTIERENLRSYKGICELLPISKMPEKPGNTGYTDI